MAKRLSDFDALTFDCFGTLIDWEAGIAAAARTWLDRHNVAVETEALLTAYAELESAAEHETPTALYSDILTRVHRGMCERFGAPVSEEQDRFFGHAIGDWPPFPDSHEALTALQKNYKLFILSNVDRRSFVRTQERLGIQFDGIFTAEDIGSYKPNHANFHYMIDRLGEIGIPKERILHTAQSLYHDHRPAKELGFTTAWINRRHNRPGSGATPVVDLSAPVDFTFTSLAEMAAARAAED